MTSYVAKIVSKKILGESLSNKFGKEDPYFEQVPATRLDGKPTSKVKKRKKALPPGISKHDGEVLTKVKRRAHRLDMALFSFLGIRFGWGSAIGLIPAVGDVLDTFMALMVLKTCCQVEGGLPTSVKIQMLFNIALDFVVGLVPFLGDLVDALFRANTRNAVLLEQHLREVGRKELQKTGQPMPAVDLSSPNEYDRIQREDPPEYHSDSPDHHDGVTSTPHHGGQASAPVAPEQARVSGGRGFFGRSKARPGDIEMGQVDNSAPVAQSKLQPKQKPTGRH